jgi:two-component system, NarL family, nitrate/nitrite response regulator NarL
MRLVLCDDNRNFCEALAVALEARGHQALAIATTADEGVAAVARHQPDACLLDFRFHEGGEGLGAARAIRDQYPDTAVLVVSGPGGRLTPLAAAQIGVAGFFGKDQELDKIAIALDTIAAGRVTSPPEPPEQDRLSALTPRETEVLRRIAAGQSTKTMAREMSVTTETLRTYVKNVLGKLGAHSRLEAAALASRVGSAGQAEPEGEHPLLAALTPREREVLALVAAGRTNRQIGEELFMSEKTASVHVSRILAKLDVSTRGEAGAVAHRLGLE